MIFAWPSFSVTKGPKRKGSLFSKHYCSRGELLNFRTQFWILILPVIDYKSYNNPDRNWNINLITTPIEIGLQMGKKELNNPMLISGVPSLELMWLPKTRLIFQPLICRRYC